MIVARNLLRHKLRTLMTLLGAAIGIAIYVATAAITDNLEQQTFQAIEGYNTDIAIQSKGAATPIHSSLTSRDLAALREIPGIAVDPLVIGAFREDWNPYAILLGAPAHVMTRFGLIEGSFPAPGARDVMAGSILAQRLGLKVGGMLTLGAEQARVVGIYRIGNRLFDGSLVTDIAEAQRRIGRKDQISLALARVDDAKSLKRTISAINARYPHLNALSTADFVGNIRLFRTVATFSKAIALISFIGSCLVVTNTLLMAVAERTREIGILMAVGWRPRLILGMLTAESLIICFCGALAGNGLALLILRLLNNSKAIGLGWIPVTVPPAAAALSLTVALALGIVAMIWPAIMLSRISPVDAIRHE